SEGFSDFSAIWYLQSIRNDNIGYNATLAHWRANILLHRGERAPLSLGHRTRSSKDENGYWILVYEKGAWVLHMLRGLLRDLDTMQEDRFGGLMRQFFADHVGGRASTRDFQVAAEKAYGGSLDWFFDEWVDGSQIPTYRVANRVVETDGKFQVTLRVRQQNVPEQFEMLVPVAVSLTDRSVARFRVRITGLETLVDLPVLPLKPVNIRFNALEGVLAEVKLESW
ncbi:MAG: hypothetical protein ABI765_01980, partial [Gemmatimonadota bacterium]